MPSSVPSGQLYFDAKSKSAIEADYCFQQAINLRPREKFMLVTYAQFLVASQRFQRAEDFFLRALEVDSDYPLGLLHYANFLIRRGEVLSGNLLLHRAAGQQSDLSHDDAACRLRVYLQDGTFKTIQARPSTGVPELKKEVIRAILTKMSNTQVYGPQQVQAMQQLYEGYDIHELDDRTRIERIMTSSEYPWYILQRPGNTSRLRFLPNVEAKDPAIAKLVLKWGFSNFAELLDHLERMRHPFSTITVESICDPSNFKVTFFHPTIVAATRPVFSSVRESLSSLILADSRWSKRLRTNRKTSKTDFLVSHFLHTAQTVFSLYGVIQISCQNCGKPINTRLLAIHRQTQQLFLSYYTQKDKSTRKQVLNLCTENWSEIIGVLAHMYTQHLEALQVFHCERILIFLVLYLHFYLTDHCSQMSKSHALSLLQPWDSNIPHWIETYIAKPYHA